MRIEHPQWVLGEQAESDWFALSWNMAVPEVREHRFAHVKELCTLYDWDGVELDWQRHGFHLPQDEGYRLRYVITDLQRAIRRMTDALARQRGKPFYLAARVSGTLEMCRHIGYDIFFGASANTWKIYDTPRGWEALDFKPQDNAEEFR